MVNNERSNNFAVELPWDANKNSRRLQYSTYFAVSRADKSKHKTHIITRLVPKNGSRVQKMTEAPNAPQSSRVEKVNFVSSGDCSKSDS